MADRHQDEEPLPAWSLPRAAAAAAQIAAGAAPRPSREWAFGGATGAGVRVAIVDSGVDPRHPAVGEVASAVAVRVSDGGEAIVEEDREGDLCGHGTACASVVRALAPACEIHSVRVLGAGFTGSGRALMGGLRHAVEQGFDVVNMSLSTTRHQFVGLLHELADRAYFRGTLMVASAHNMPVESYPWRFSSVVSVGSHEEDDPFCFYYNPRPPVEFFARGVDVEVAWPGGGTIRTTGNSIATPHISALAALVLSKHRRLRPFELKSVLYLTANNVEASDER